MCFPETKRKILATLGNFAYDPVNYGWLYQAGAAQLFIGKTETWDRELILVVKAVSNVPLSDAVVNPEEDEELKRIGMFGLCNNALGKLIKSYAM